MNNKYLIKNEKEMIDLGVEFSKKLKPQDTVLLFGELGSGKTTFTKGIAKGLKIKERIVSPTFILIRSYKIAKNIIKTLYHVDLYRIEKSASTPELAITDLLNDENGIVVIEWPEIIEKVINTKVWKLHFKYNENERNVEIKYE